MDKKGTVRRLFVLMGGYRWLEIVSMVTVAASAAMNLLAYVRVYYVGEAVLTTAGDLSSIDRQAIAALGWDAVLFIMAAFGIYGIGLLFSHLTAFNTVARLRDRIVCHLGRVSLGYHVANPSGKLRKIIEKNTDNIENTIAHTMPDFVNAIALPVAYIACMFAFDWRLSLACLAPLVAGFFVLAWMLNDSSKSFYAKQQKSAEDMASATTEYVRGIAVVKVFGQTAESFKRYHDSVEEHRSWMLKYALSMRLPDSLYTVTINAGFLFLIPTAIVLHDSAKGGAAATTAAATFIFFCVLIPMTVTMLTRIMNAASNLMVSSASLDAVDGILAQPVLERPLTPKEPKCFDIALDHVSFRYKPDSPLALDDVTLRIPAGTVCALVGQSGGGKTTVANLIARFWDVQEGTVRIGGDDVREMDYAWLAAHTSIVFQDTRLFKASIADNVAYAKPTASREEVLRALHLAQCDDILKKFPNGADAVVGARGVYLSGGEMQRIALARAMLKDAPIVLLDEATAYSDAENEHLIQQALSKLLRGKTVLMIAHRLSTVVDADQICVVENGRIVERGVHDELIAQAGFYAHMYKEYERSVEWKIGGAA
jgi:ABC superfamily ATP binding cassette transporter, ABC/membrane protein